MSKCNRKQNTFQFIIALIAACVVFAVMQGIHDNYGIMMNGIIEHSGIDYTSVSFVIAVGQILYGATQPLFGMLALKKSNAHVLFLGICMMAAGLIATPLCTSIWSLLIFFGIVLPSGTGALCFGIVMGAIAPIIGEERAAVASGIVQASAGIGDALMSPALQYLTAWRGIAFSLPVFSVPILLTIPATIWLNHARKKEEIPSVQQEENVVQQKNDSLLAILYSAAHDPAYWCLLIGFSTCGFHMSIIETHLFSQYISCGIPENIASLTLTVYGIMTMLGAIITGFAGQRFRMKNVLAAVYTFRIFIAISFIFLPKTIPFAFIATGLLGLSGDSTVPPTTGIISAKVGVARMSVVYGSIFIGHQIGAFFSAWLGGICLSATGEYTLIWLADMVFSIMAAVASFKIRE